MDSKVVVIQAIQNYKQGLTTPKGGYYNVVLKNEDARSLEVSEIMELIKIWINKFNNRPINEAEREELIKLLTK